MRVKYANDEESFREKFTLIVWIGEEVKVMRRAKVRFPLHSPSPFLLSPTLAKKPNTHPLPPPPSPPRRSFLIKVSVHAASVKEVFSNFSIQVNASSPSDLKEDEIVVRLRKAGGASYDKV